MENQKLHMSNEGKAALRKREGAIFRYYNDAANHCTYGIGILAHHGPCTPQELRRSVTPADVDQQLSQKIMIAERAVRQHVKRHALSQNQFDALVSFTFNVGANGAGKVLGAADRGLLKDVSAQIKKYVYVHPRDSDGKKLPAVRLQGLAHRREEEAAPFEAQGPRK